MDELNISPLALREGGWRVLLKRTNGVHAMGPDRAYELAEECEEEGFRQIALRIREAARMATLPSYDAPRQLTKRPSGHQRQDKSQVKNRSQQGLHRSREIMPAG